MGPRAPSRHKAYPPRDPSSNATVMIKPMLTRDE